MPNRSCSAGKIRFKRRKFDIVPLFYERSTSQRRLERPNLPSSTPRWTRATTIGFRKNRRFALRRRKRSRNGSPGFTLTLGWPRDNPIEKSVASSGALDHLRETLGPGRRLSFQRLDRGRLRPGDRNYGGTLWLSTEEIVLLTGRSSELGLILLTSQVARGTVGLVGVELLTIWFSQSAVTAARGIASSSVTR